MSDVSYAEKWTWGWLAIMTLGILVGSTPTFIIGAIGVIVWSAADWVSRQ